MRNDILDATTPGVLRDFLSIACGELLGTGVYRKVFANRLDPSTVIKLEDDGGSFHNIKEWELWQEWRDYKPVAKHLAPCVAISSNGAWLVMKRTKPTDNIRLPDKMPGFLTDIGRKNFGMLEGKLVCHDYGHIRMILHTGTRKVHWGD